MIQMSPRSCTKRSAASASAMPRSVAIMTGRLRSRSTSSPNAGATSPGIARTKKTRPALALEPVRSLTQTLRTRYIARSPKSERLWPTRSRRVSRSRNRWRMRSVAGGGGADREADGEHMHRRGALRPAFGGDPLDVRLHELDDALADRFELLRGDVEERLAHERRVAPLGCGGALPAEPVTQPVEVAIEDDGRERGCGRVSLGVDAQLVPAVLHRADPPGAHTAGAGPRLLQEAVFAQLAQVKRAIGRREPEHVRGGGGGQLALASHELHELDPGGVRECAHDPRVGEAALVERHVSKHIFRERYCQTASRPA